MFVVLASTLSSTRDVAMTKEEPARAPISSWCTALHTIGPQSGFVEGSEETSHPLTQYLCLVLVTFCFCDDAENLRGFLVICLFSGSGDVGISRDKRSLYLSDLPLKYLIIWVCCLSIKDF